MKFRLVSPPLLTFSIFGVLLIGLGVLTMWTGSNIGLGIVEVLIGSALLARSMRSSVEVDDEVAIVRNLLRSRTIPRADITGVGRATTLLNPGYDVATLELDALEAGRPPALKCQGLCCPKGIRATRAQAAFEQRCEALRAELCRTLSS